MSEPKATYEAPGQAPLPGESAEPKQLNIEVPARLYELLSRTCARRGESKRAAVIRLLEVYVAGNESDRAWHITGEECPLSRLIEGIAAELGHRREVSR